MARCSGTTKKGSQCRLNAMEGADYCAIHLTQDPRAPSGSEAIDEFEGRLTETMKTVLGVAIAAGIILSALIKKS